MRYFQEIPYFGGHFGRHLGFNIKEGFNLLGKDRNEILDPSNLGLGIKTTVLALIGGK
jgi:hypothetical protein